MTYEHGCPECGSLGKQHFANCTSSLSPRRDRGKMVQPEPGAPAGGYAPGEVIEIPDGVDVRTFAPTPPRTPMTKTKLLDDAKATVADRGVAYGGVEDNFARIARLWNMHLLNRSGHEGKLTPGDVAMMMVLMKIARLENQPDHPDSWTDIAGYAACGAEITDGTGLIKKPA